MGQLVFSKSENKKQLMQEESSFNYFIVNKDFTRKKVSLLSDISSTRIIEEVLIKTITKIVANKVKYRFNKKQKLLGYVYNF